MALTKSILTGRVVLPTDAAPINAELVFTLSGLDSEGGDILPPGDPARCVLINGELPPGYSIWRNTEGYRGTHYIVTVMWTDMTRQGIRETIRELGKIQVGDNASYVLADLLAEGTVPAGETFWSAITEAEYDAVIDAADRAEAAAAAAESMTAVMDFVTVAAEPIWASSRMKFVTDAGQWWAKRVNLMVVGGQSNRVRYSITPGAGESQGNVFVWNGSAWLVATPALIGDITYVEAHRVSLVEGRPVFVVHGAVAGTAIARWVPGGDLFDALKASAIAAMADLASRGYQISRRVYDFSQGEGEYDLAPLHSLSTFRYPAFINGVRGADYLGSGCQIIITELLRQSMGGTTDRVNREWQRLISAGYTGVHLAPSDGLATEDPTDGSVQVVHFNPAGRIEMGLRCADIQLGLSNGVTSGDVAGRITATTERIWKERAYTWLGVINIGAGNVNNQVLNLLTAITGTPILWEVGGVTTEIASGVTASTYTYVGASDTQIVIWGPTDANYDQAMGFSAVATPGQGGIRSFVLNPLAHLASLYISGHSGLMHNVNPSTWGKRMKTFRLDAAPLVTFDSFVAADMPKSLSLLTFTSTTPVPGLVRAAINAENTARGGSISVTYSGLYASEGFRRLRPEDFGTSGLGVVDDGLSMARFTAWGGTLELTPGANYRITAKQVMNLPAGAILEGNGASITLEYTDTSDGLSFAAGAGSIIQNVIFRFPNNAGTAHYQERMLGLSTGAKLINCRFIAAVEQPVSVDDSKDGCIRILGEDVVIDGCQFYGVYRCIQATPDASTARSRVSNTRFDLYGKGVDTGGTMTGGVLENLTFGNAGAAALTDPGVTSITESSPDLTIRNIRVEGSGDHGIYLEGSIYVSGLVMTDVQVRGSGQCNIKLRRQIDFILADIHGFDTSDGNAPDTNEDVLRLECCRNGRVIGVSGGEMTGNGGYEGIFIDACSDIDFIDVLLRGTSADFIYITDVNGPAEASPPTLGNLRFWGVRCFAPGAVPLLNIQATGAVGPIHLDGVDYRNATGSAVITNIGGAATDIVVKGNISTSGTMLTNTAGGAAVQIEAFWDRYIGGTLQRSYVDGKFTMYSGQFNLTAGSTLAQYVQTTGTAAAGAYIGGYGGSRLNSGSPGWAMVGKQGSADADQVGVAILVHQSSATSDVLVEAVEFAYNLHAKFAATVKTASYAVSALPSASGVGAGARAMVSDGSVVAAGNFGNVVASGGANVVPVYSDGTNWRIG